MRLIAGLTEVMAQPNRMVAFLPTYSGGAAPGRPNFPSSSPWRATKNRHCGRMTEPSENKAKAGAMIVPVTPFEQNCTLIWCTATRKAVVIDPGGDVPKIQAAIKQADVAVEKIWLTHGHIDHVGGAADL